MKDALSRLADLRRPRLLIEAARIGAQDYARDFHLKRLLGATALPGNSVALHRLLEIESWMDGLRRDEDPTYAAARHVEALAAILAEAAVLRADRATSARSAPQIPSAALPIRATEAGAAAMM